MIEVDLARLERGERAGPAVPVLDDPALAEIAGWGGTALGLALLAREVRVGVDPAPPLVLAVGACVRAGLPTAARLSVLARSPLSGLLSEGQVGGELGPRLAAVADALVVRGRTELPGGVLVVGADGRARLVSRPDLCGADPVSTWRALVAEHGPAGVLCIGPAGERGLPYANLARGGERPSFVGRGGLGAVLGRAGLKAVVVAAEPGTLPARSATAALTAALAASPRLAERAAGGTMELYGAIGARGDLGARNYSTIVGAEGGARLQGEARERGRGRSGCRGCPTPCGWVFERSDGTRMGAHFAATHSLGVNLGLNELDDALRLLGVCDRLGLDAKEAGALLAVEAVARERGLTRGPALWGDAAGFAALLEGLVDNDPEREPMRAGAVAYARSLGLASELAATRQQPARPESNLAALLGQCVSAAGVDPMRSFPFLIESAGRAGLERLCGAVALPPGAEDPRSPVAKGRLVAWHEDLVSAVDATGFCSFSTAGLLVDELCDLDTLAGWILPPALRAPTAADWAARSPGERLLACGANLALLRRELNASFDAPEDQDRPAWAAAALDLPGMLDEYHRVRGLDPDGRPTPAVRALLARPALVDRLRSEVGDDRAASSFPADDEDRSHESSTGTVEVRALGSLGDALGRQRRIAVRLPRPAIDLLRELADEDPALAARLFANGRPIPAIWRDGTLLPPETRVAAGDVLDLVTAISGG